MKSRLFVFSLLLALGGSAVAVAVAADANPKRTFSFRLPGEPETLDWNRAHTMVETYVLMNIMEGLLTVDSQLKVVPSLARSWGVSKDGKTYTFKLRNDVKWSDGVPMRAKDFVFSWKRLLSPVTAASYAYFLFDIENAEAFYKGQIKEFEKVGIKALDEFTFQVKLAKPVAHWIYMPTFWVTFPLREDVVQKYGAGWETPGRMVTLGPYTLASHDHDAKIVLKANPNYYGTRGNVEQAVGLIIKDASTALNLYDAGRLDFMTDISTLDLHRLRGRAELKTFPYLKTGYMAFVTKKFPASNVRLRRAIAMAIDRSKLPEILHGGQKPAGSFVPPGLLAHRMDIGLKYDPAMAKYELSKSGLDITRPISLEFILPNWDKDLTLVQFVQGELKKNLGIDVVLQPFDHKTFRAQLDLHAFPIYNLSWSADYPDPDNFLSLFLGSSGNNRTTWKNANYDELVLAGRFSQDKKKREQLYTQAQKILLEEEAVVLPLYYEPNMALIRNRAKGVELNPLNYLLFKKVNLDG